MTPGPLVAEVVEADGAWRRLILGTPPGNILSHDAVRALRRAVDVAAAAHGLRWLTLEGAGEHFSYGASIPEHLPEPMRAFLPDMHALVRALLAFPTPTAALVGGRCLGGGFELALCCDDILASAEATFGLPEVRLAAFPPAAAALLPVRVGASRASRAMVTGDAQDAAYWHDAGLVSLVAPPATRLEAARTWFEAHLAPRSAVALRHAALAAREVWRPAVERALLVHERAYLDGLLQSADGVEGIRAWIEKRLPQWRDE